MITRTNDATYVWHPGGPRCANCQVPTPPQQSHVGRVVLAGRSEGRVVLKGPAAKRAPVQVARHPDLRDIEEQVGSVHCQEDDRKVCKYHFDLRVTFINGVRTLVRVKPTIENLWGLLRAAALRHAGSRMVAIPKRHRESPDPHNAQVRQPCRSTNQRAKMAMSFAQLSQVAGSPDHQFPVLDHPLHRGVSVTERNALSTVVCGRSSK